MSRNAVAAMAVVLVSGFAGCAATARANEPVVVPTIVAPASMELRGAMPSAPLRAVGPTLRAFSAAGSG